MRIFSRAWITGSTNYKVSNVVDHATSDVHKSAVVRKRADSIRARGEPAALSSEIGHSLSMLDGVTRARMERKFDLCLVMAKQGLSSTTG